MSETGIEKRERAKEYCLLEVPLAARRSIYLEFGIGVAVHVLGRAMAAVGQNSFLILWIISVIGLGFGMIRLSRGPASEAVAKSCRVLFWIGAVYSVE